MKKYLVIILALILALPACLLAGCGGDDSSSGKSDGKKTAAAEDDEDETEATDLDAKDVFDGTWETEIDYAAILREQIKSNLDYFDDFEFPITLIFSFDNGDYTIGVNESSVKAAIKNFTPVYRKAFTNFLVERYDADEDDFDDLVAVLSPVDTLDKYISQSMELLTEKILSVIDRSGEYAIDGNEIAFDRDEAVFEFKLFSKKKFKFTKMTGDDAEIYEESLPWTFKKK